MPALLSDRPRPESLRRFLDALSVEAAEVAAIVVYGSMAWGDYDAESDWDVLLALRRAPGLPIARRFMHYGALSPDGWVQVFPYTTGELDSMFASFHLTVLDALEEGVPVYDDGAWRALRERFLVLRHAGILTPLTSPGGWRISEQP